MTLVKYTPKASLWRPERNIFNDIDNWLLNAFEGQGNHIGNHDYSPRYDIRSCDDVYDLMIELPGVSKKDISIDISDGVITISGSRKDSDEEKIYSTSLYGKFSRSFYVPDDSDDQNISARMDSGVLRISIPRLKSKKPDSKRVKIK